MKHILFFLLCLLLTGPAVQAQNATTKEGFQAYSIKLNEQIRPLVDGKQYQQALALFAQWHTAYDVLAQPLKREFAGYLPNMYYNEACYYSLAKDRANALAKFKSVLGNLG